AVAAGDVERDDDAVARLDMGNARADGLYHAHGLVTEDVARGHVRRHDLVEVKVRAANAARGDAHDGVRGLLDARVRYLLDSYISLAVPRDCLHIPSSSVRVSLTAAYPARRPDYRTLDTMFRIA